LSTIKGRLRDHLIRSRDDPDYFNSVILARPPLHRAQKEWCRALVEHRAVALETSNMLGKDWLIGTLVPWWLYTRKDSLVIVTGPGQTLLGSVTWKEVRRAVEGSPWYKAGLLPAKITAGVKTSPQTLEVGPGWQALGFSTTSVERMSGQHAGELLGIVTEASGLEPEAWEAMDSLGAAKQFWVGNPIRPDGGFVDRCNQGVRDERDGLPKAESIRYINAGAYASPHAHLESSPVGLASAGWIRDMERQHGRESLWFRVHVLAQRPTLSHEILINPELLALATSDRARLAAAEWRRALRGGPVRIAVDVANGDGAARTVIVVRDDVGIIEVHASADWSTPDAAGIVAGLAAKHRIGKEERRISYDAAGVIGKSFGLALAGKGYPNAVAYFGANKAGKRFTNMRTAAAAAFARRLDPDAYARAPDGETARRVDRLFHIPSCPELPSILEELRELRIALKGDKSELEKKEDFVLRLGRSPDYADAVCQSFWEAAFTG
jgi:hypothetical protein